VHPVLFTLPSWLPLNMGGAISTYGVAAVVATMIGVLWGIHLARGVGFSLVDCLELALIVVVGGMVGSKVFHTLFEADGHILTDGTTAHNAWELIRDDPWHWARLFDAGAVFYGAIIGGAVACLLLCWRRGYRDLLVIADCSLPGVTLGMVLGRLGCFASGCCYGAPTNVPWAVHFPSTHETHGTAVHPTQLYDSAVGVVLFVVSMWMLRAKADRKVLPGEPFLLMAGLYAVARAVTETMRADVDRGLWVGLSTSQWTSVAVLVVVIFFAVRRRKRAAMV
jgi:phosphatidylglycerol---prolipoprotein diacylglyceryl transferase